MHASEPALGELYRDAVEAVAAGVFAEIADREAKDDALERALRALRRIERSVKSQHAWIFRDPAILTVSDHVVEALEVCHEGRREWLHAHLPSAVAAVARFDVMAEVVERMGTAADGDDVAPAEAGEA